MLQDDVGRMRTEIKVSNEYEYMRMVRNEWVDERRVGHRIYMHGPEQKHRTRKAV